MHDDNIYCAVIASRGKNVIAVFCFERWPHASFCYREILSVAWKYYIQCLGVWTVRIKYQIWKSLADTII